MSGGFFRGTSADQDRRFSKREAKLLKSKKFAPELENLVDMTKVNMDVVRPWIANRVTELIGSEDEVVINFIYGLLEGKAVNGKHIQIQLSGFIKRNTGKFMKELWALLLSAHQNVSSVPQQSPHSKEDEAKKMKQAETNEIQRKKEGEKQEVEQEKKNMELDLDVKDDAVGSGITPAGDLERYKGNVERRHVRDSQYLDSSHHSPSLRHKRSTSRSKSPNPRVYEPPSKTRSISSERKHYCSSKSKEEETKMKQAETHPIVNEIQRKKEEKQEVKQEKNNMGGDGARLIYKHTELDLDVKDDAVGSSITSAGDLERYKGNGQRRHGRQKRSTSRSKSPNSRRRTPSPTRNRVHSPRHHRSSTTVRRRSRTPTRRTSVRYMSRSPLRRRSPFPARRRSPSPPLSGRRRSPSPHHQSPSSAKRRYQRSLTPGQQYVSPVGKRRRSSLLGRERFSTPVSVRSPQESNSPSDCSSLSPLRRGSVKSSSSPIQSRGERARQKRSTSRSKSPNSRVYEPPSKSRSISSERKHHPSSPKSSVPPHPRHNFSRHSPPPSRRSPPPFNLRRRTPSPTRNRVHSPRHHRSRTTVRRRLRTPTRRTSVRYMSRSPLRRRSPFPARRRSPSPPLSGCRRSPSPHQQSSYSAKRRYQRSLTPVQQYVSRVGKRRRSSLLGRERFSTSDCSFLSPLRRGSVKSSSSSIQSRREGTRPRSTSSPYSSPSPKKIKSSRKLLRRPQREKKNRKRSRSTSATYSSPSPKKRKRSRELARRRQPKRENRKRSRSTSATYSSPSPKERKRSRELARQRQPKRENRKRSRSTYSTCSSRSSKKRERRPKSELTKSDQNVPPLVEFVRRKPSLGPVVVDLDRLSFLEVIDSVRDAILAVEDTKLVDNIPVFSEKRSFVDITFTCTYGGELASSTLKFATDDGYLLGAFLDVWHSFLDVHEIPNSEKLSFGKSYEDMLTAAISPERLCDVVVGREYLFRAIAALSNSQPNLTYSQKQKLWGKSFLVTSLMIPESVRSGEVKKCLFKNYEKGCLYGHRNVEIAKAWGDACGYLISKWFFPRKRVARRRFPRRLKNLEIKEAEWKKLYSVFKDSKISMKIFGRGKEVRTWRLGQVIPPLIWD